MRHHGCGPRPPRPNRAGSPCKAIAYAAPRPPSTHVRHAPPHSRVSASRPRAPLGFTALKLQSVEWQVVPTLAAHVRRRPIQYGPGSLSLGFAGGDKGVAEQHCDSHRTDTARYGRDGAGHLENGVGIDVATQS